MAQRETDALSRFHQMARSPTRIRRDDGVEINGVTGRRNEIWSYKAVAPFEIQERKRMRMVLYTHDAFHHTGATTAEQSYDLNETAVETPNSLDSQVFSDGTELTKSDTSTLADDEYFIDYSTTTDELTVNVDTDVTIHAYYVSSDALEVEIAKLKPGTTGKIEDVLYDDLVSDLNRRDQNRDPAVFEFNQSAYQGIVPKDWELIIYQKGDNYPIQWDDSDTDTSGNKTTNDTSPAGAIVDIPIKMASNDVTGLSREVANDISDRR